MARFSSRLPILVISLCSLLSSGCDRPPIEARFPGANIILISIDTLRADLVGAYGQERKTTKFIDGLAAESLLFRRGISQSCFTAPSHMTILTSLYPSVHRVSNWTFEVTAGERNRLLRSRLHPEAPNLTTALAAAGYSTAAFVGGGNVSREMGFDEGFGDFDDDQASGMNGNRETLFNPAIAIEWIEKHKEEPIFLFLHTYIPHGPYLPPPPWDTRFSPDYEGKIPSDREKFFGKKRDYRIASKKYWSSIDQNDEAELNHLRAMYAGDVGYADESLGKILEGLRTSGVLEKSIVVLVSDHGEEFLEHGSFQHYRKLYDELVHVPLMIRFPRGWLAGREVLEPTPLIDIMPTLLELVGVEAPENYQGRSRALTLEGGREDEPVISEVVLKWKRERDPDSGSETWQPTRVLRSIREGSYTYISRGGIQSEELYDREADPTEQVNLASRPDQTQRLAGFRRHLESHDRRCRELGRKFEGAPIASLRKKTIEELKALGYMDEKKE